eukprot:3370342-Prymnesium_polylepis.1
MRQGGYLVAKKVKVSSAAAKRARAAAADVKEEDEEVINVDTTLKAITNDESEIRAPRALA